MVFSSLVFIFLFLPITLALYWVVPNRRRNLILFAASCFFYSWGAPKFIFVLLGSSAVDYLLGHRICRQGLAAGDRKILLAAGLAVNISLLLYFKYANFFVDQVNSVLAVTGGQSVAWTRVALPIGISFFTFQKISYLVDVYRGTARPASSFLSYALYVSLFPQLIAGPIIRYHDVATQLQSRRHTSEKMYSGICRFCLGLGKKILIANTLGEVADSVFALPSSELTTTAAWLGAFCYSFQIYYDFSGYSDMAIGLGRMFGFEYLENFNQPYLAKNFTEFWRRWHISLSNWMREYLYIPLGGNRKGGGRMFVNLWIVFLLSGFWHGASWNFIAWGAFHGFFLSLDKLRSRYRYLTLPGPVAISVTFTLLAVSWVLFRSENLGAAWLFIQRMFAGPGEMSSVMTLDTLINTRQLVILLLGICCSFLPIPSPLSVLTAGQWRRQGAGPVIALGIGSLAIFVVSVSMLSTSSFNPFIYFRF
jgi:alginate O-acetyltransferase complex protein AlgI